MSGGGISGAVTCRISFSGEAAEAEIVKSDAPRASTIRSEGGKIIGGK
jgi:hypothetical protein